MFFENRKSVPNNNSVDKNTQMNDDGEMHIDIVPFGDSAAVDTRSIATEAHTLHNTVDTHPHINEVLSKSDDLELVPLHTNEEQTAPHHSSSTKSEAKSTASGNRRTRSVDLVKRQSEKDLIMKHDYLPFRGRRN